MNNEYILQVYMRGAGWLDFGVYFNKDEATKAAQARAGQVRVIDGETETVEYES